MVMDPNWTKSLDRWKAAGLIDADAAARIHAFEAEHAGSARLRWPILIAIAFGAVMIAGGVLLFIAANWDALAPSQRFSLVLVLVAIFHLGGAATAEQFPAMSAALHAIGTAALGGGIALAGQIFNLDEHWPGGIMLWALGAGIGWGVLRHTSQIVFFAILVPVWLVGEWIVAAGINFESSGWIVTSGVFLLAMTYLTAVGPGKSTPSRKALLWLGAVALVISAGALSELRWASYYEQPLWLPRNLAAIGWSVAIGGPLLLAAWLRRVDAWPNALAAVWVVILFFMGNATVDVTAYAWWALGAVALAAWGVRDSRAERINLGAIFFAATILAFYFSRVMDKLGRSASLVGLGLLFLGGGWALERVRRRLVRQTREGA